jgi:UDP-N-acetylmuramate--alanine ligase
VSGGAAGIGPDLSGPRRVHVIGAGGSGMSAIATVLLAMGHRVTGTDTADSPALRHLESLGAEVAVGHQPALMANAEVVVRSTAIPDDDPEVVAARTSGRTVWRRADVLAAICRLRRTIAVSGTHGKTTTSSMLAVTLEQLGWHPSFIIGGDIAGIGPGARWDGEGGWFVVEADESDGTFVELGAEATMVTSVEPDHLEFYGGMDRLVAAFERFVTEPAGPVVLCGDDPGAARLAGGPRRGQVWTYGRSPESDVRITAVELGRSGSTFELEVKPGAGGAPGTGGPVNLSVTIAVPGLHNVRNAAGVVTMAAALGAGWDQAAAAVAEFRGVARRFESRGEAGGVSFIDGYDHLPTEVAAAIATAQSGDWPRIVTVFQPQRFSRTEGLWRDFADSFVGADVVVITGIYPAGEAPRPGVSGHLVFEAVQASHPDSDLHYAETLDEAAQLLTTLLRPGDLCLTLGAGNVTTLPDRLLERLSPGPPS